MLKDKQLVLSLKKGKKVNSTNQVAGYDDDAIVNTKRYSSECAPRVIDESHLCQVLRCPDPSQRGGAGGCVARRTSSSSDDSFSKNL